MPDIGFAGSGLQEIHAPYGIVGVGSGFDAIDLNAYFDDDLNFDSCTFGTAIPSDCITAYRRIMEDRRLPVPEDGFVTVVRPNILNLISPSLYYARTQEGATIALMQVGYYIGGIDRRHYYWRYVERSRCRKMWTLHDFENIRRCLHN